VDNLAHDNNLPAQKAASDWNNQVGPKPSITIDVVPYDCGTGPGCIRMQTSNDPNDPILGCADSNRHRSIRDRRYKSNSVIRLPVDYGSIPSIASDGPRPRTSQWLGLDHTNCSAANSIMGINLSMHDPTGMALGPTANDALTSKSGVPTWATKGLRILDTVLMLHLTKWGPMLNSRTLAVVWRLGWLW